MPEIIIIPPSDTNTAEVILSKEGLVVDSRFFLRDRYNSNQKVWKFDCTIEGITLKVTRIDRDDGWHDHYLHFRVYDPSIEPVPEFTSRSYTYHGLFHERPPLDVEEIVVDPSVTIIKKEAFKDCEVMKRCIMGDSVERIEMAAFHGCVQMRSIRLSRSLLFIGERAFWGCESVRCLYIPISVEEIQYRAFMWCIRLKILLLPPSIDLGQVGYQIVQSCHALLVSGAGTAPQYERGYPPPNNDQVHRWLKHRHDHFPLLRLFADPDITAPVIRDIIQDHGTTALYQTDDDYGFTPLHILTRCNGFVSDDAIIACFDANPEALFIRDGDDTTPLEYLWNDDNNKLDVITHMMRDLCVLMMNEGM